MISAPVRAYVGLGGNEGDARATVLAAMRALAELPGTSLREHSSLYRTAAWGKTDQADFINAVAALETTLSANELMAALLAIERQFGRARGEGPRWGPRTLDLDLLLYGDRVLDEPGLTVPHPHLHERAFVLVPLAQIAPQLRVPGRGEVAVLLTEVDRSGVEAIP